jgi:hypothetical protein
VSVSQRGGESKGSSVGVGDDGSSVVSGGSDHGGGVVSDGGSVHGLGGNGGGVDGVSGLGDDGVESVVGVGGVVDGAGGAVSLDQGVVSLDDISVASLGLALLVAGVGISHSVFEGVVGDGLHKKPSIKISRNMSCNFGQLEFRFIFFSILNKCSITYIMVHGRVSHSRGGEGGESAKSDGEL